MDKETKYQLGIVIMLFSVAYLLYTQRMPKSMPAEPITSTAPPEAVTALPPSPTSILRIESRPPGRDYTVHRILVDKEEVARFILQDGRRRQIRGRIPDGEIKFFNEWEKTYGFEHYRNGRREGPYLEYYDNNQVRIEAEYKDGRMLTKTSYYINGAVHMEVDYRSARLISWSFRDRSNFIDIGTGKMYRLDGSLKYEWSFTDVAQHNYLKVYNRQGDMVKETIYNGHGRVIKEWQAVSS